MIDRKVLQKTGCTPERLREIFTCTDASRPEHKIRKKFEERCQDRIHQGVSYTMQFARKWQAVDMAWDSTPILDENIPLMLWAQGKINDGDLIKRLKDLKVADQYCAVEKVKDDKGVERETIKINVPRLYEVSINLIRTYCTRGMAAQSSRFSNLWPYFKYEPRGTDEVSKLKGDATSQRVDAMADAYNYRHLFPQGYLQMFLYARSVCFVRSAWDYKVGWRLKNPRAEKVEEMETKSVCEREGVDFAIPHPSRMYWDLSAPLPNINTDNGPGHIGYWDLVPFRNISGDDAYFNRDAISVSDGFTSLFDQYPDYFGYYFDPCVLKHPELQQSPAARNDRVGKIGKYAGCDEDKGCLLVQHFEKINPKREGIGELNTDIWIRLVLAGDCTVVAAEFLPSRPAAYGGINENDSRIINQSRAMELMTYQDQMTNLWSQLLFTLRTGMIQIWCIDKDIIEPETKAYIEKMMKSGQYYATPHALFYSGSKFAEAGFANPSANARAVLQIVQGQIQTQLDSIMKSISELLNLCERLMVISPNELGQPNPREVSARETTEIATSVNAISSFISDGIDEQRAAVKRIIYESLVCFGHHEVRVPVIDRYTAKTIKSAGFTLPTEVPDDQIVPLKVMITGHPSSLEYDYLFDSRDGADRVSNPQMAQVLGNVISQFVQVPALLKAMGKRRLFEWANEVTRLSGAAFDLKLDDGEDETIELEHEAPPDLVQRIDRIEQMMAQVLDTLTKAGAQIPAPAAPALPAQASVAPNGSPAALGEPV